MALEFVYVYCYCCRFEQFHSFVIAAIHSRRLRVKPSIHADWGRGGTRAGQRLSDSVFCTLYSNKGPWARWETTETRKQQHRDRSPDDAGDMEPRSPLAKSPFRCDFLSRLVFYYIIMSVITLKRKHGRVNRSKTKK